MDLSKETLSMALEYLDKIGTKIGMTADTIWPWLIKQQYVYFGTSLTALTIGLVMLIVALYISNKHHPFDDDKYGTAKVDLQRILRCATMILSVVFTIVGGICTICNMPKLFNPEYYALKNLLEMIK